MENFTNKQMVLVSRHNTDFYEIDDRFCTLLEIEELKTTSFLFYHFRNRVSEILSSRERYKLLKTGELCFRKLLYCDDQPSLEDTFDFSIINVFVVDGKVFVNTEDLLWKGTFTEKDKAQHIIRIAGMNS